MAKHNTASQPGFLERTAGSVRNLGIGVAVAAETAALLVPPVAVALGGIALAGVEVAVLGEIGRRAAPGRPRK